MNSKWYWDKEGKTNPKIKKNESEGRKQAMYISFAETQNKRFPISNFVCVYVCVWTRFFTVTHCVQLMYIFQSNNTNDRQCQ